VKFSPENTDYSATYALTKMGLFFMKEQNVIKITYLPGFYLRVLNRTT
jgi:hypothetical protein